MNLAPRTESYGADNPAWLASAHGTGNCESVTLKVADFESFKTNHGNVIPSGIPLKKNSDGTYSPVTAAGDTLAGFLYTAQSNTGMKQVAPMLWHGSIHADRLPTGAFDVATLTKPNTLFRLKKEAN